MKVWRIRWDCKYHVVFIPKNRRKVIYGNLRHYLGEIFHELANQKGVKIVEGHLMPDHIHMCISIPPKYAVSSVVGYLKGKSAIAIARKFKGRQVTFYKKSRLRWPLYSPLGLFKVMSCIEHEWEKFSNEICELKILLDISGSVYESTIHRAKEKGEIIDLDQKRYFYHAQSVFDVNGNRVILPNKEFSLQDRIELIYRQQTRSNMLALVQAYEAFKSFVKSIYKDQEPAGEIDLLVINNQDNYYFSCKETNQSINLLYLINIIRSLRNKIAHTSSIKLEDVLKECEGSLNSKKIKKTKFIFSEHEVERLRVFLAKNYIEQDLIVLSDLIYPKGGKFKRVQGYIDKLHTFAYEIKEYEKCK